MVNVSKVYGIVDGLRESGQVILDEELIRIYQDWERHIHLMKAKAGEMNRGVRKKWS